MSYQPLQKQDSLSEFVSRIADLKQVLGHLGQYVKASDPEGQAAFTMWLEKAIKIDPRGTFLHLNALVESGEISDDCGKIFLARMAPVVEMHERKKLDYRDLLD